VTIFERANHLRISPSQTDQLSLLPSAGRDMSTNYSVVIIAAPVLLLLYIVFYCVYVYRV